AARGDSGPGPAMERLPAARARGRRRAPQAPAAPPAPPAPPAPDHQPPPAPADDPVAALLAARQRRKR
ncbi:MAG: hypothetical protein HGA45_44085, partial [Chloroflexales bacterium]|nr:hypothetical protein [Chloroflexales bacterium]